MWTVVGNVVGSRKIVMALSQDEGFCEHATPKIAVCVMVDVVRIVVVPVPRAEAPSEEAKNVNLQDVGLDTQ